MVRLSTFNQLKERIRSDLADRIPVTFLDEELFQYAIEGANVIYNYVAQAQPSFLETKIETTLSKGSDQISLPSDCLFLSSLWVTDSSGYTTPIVHVGKHTIMEYSALSGKPQYYTVYGTTIQVAPKASTDFTVTMFYVPVYTPPTSFDADLGISSIFDTLIVEYVIIRAHNRNTRQPVVEQQFFNLKSETLRNILNRFGDEKLTMKKTMYRDYWVSW